MGGKELTLCIYTFNVQACPIQGCNLMVFTLVLEAALVRILHQNLTLYNPTRNSLKEAEKHVHSINA